MLQKDLTVKVEEPSSDSKNFNKKGVNTVEVGSTSPVVMNSSDGFKKIKPIDHEGSSNNSSPLVKR